MDCRQASTSMLQRRLKLGLLRVPRVSSTRLRTAVSSARPKAQAAPDPHLA
ncbi:MAG: hypothetical protein ACLR4Z_15345 [Butyricicoccaceae bacterium]